MLYELTRRAVAVVENSSTYLLVNDRFDIALAAGAHGVQLTTQSLPTRVVRDASPPEFIVGVSTHSLAEAEAAKSGGADFILFGPVFETKSKRAFGDPQGVGRLAQIVASEPGLPVIAIGGITTDHVPQCSSTGAAGIAAIRLLANAGTLEATASEIRRIWMSEHVA